MKQPTMYKPELDDNGELYVYRTDIDFLFRFFGNPVTWLAFAVVWDKYNGYGIRFGPILIMIVVNKFVKFYKDESQ